VRRDNIEHLLLIGGPNDVLVEGTINRVEGVLGRPVEQQRPAPPAAANWPTGPGGAPPREQPEAASPPGPAPKPAPVNLPPDLFAPAPAKPALGPAAAPPPAPPPAPAPPKPAAPPPKPPAADIDPLESLEAEMARLLGRPGDKE
jgi:hypothetical protein